MSSLEVRGSSRSRRSWTHAPVKPEFLRLYDQRVSDRLEESGSGQWCPTVSSVLAWTIVFGASAGTGVSTRGCGSGLPCLLRLIF